MKKIITIALLFISILSFSQINDTWDAVKIGTSDMSRIYVGDKLVWQKSDVCEYGDLANYVNTTVYYAYNNMSIGYHNDFSILSEVKQCLDSLRNSIGNITGGGNYAAFYGYNINNYALQIEDNSAICELRTTEDKYRIVNDNSVFIPGGARIIKFTNGIITSSESY